MSHTNYPIIQDGWYHDRLGETRLSVQEIEVVRLRRDYVMLAACTVLTSVGVLLDLFVVSAFCVACMGTDPPPPPGLWQVLLIGFLIGCFFTWAGGWLHSTAGGSRRLILRLRSGYTYKRLFPGEFARELAKQITAKEIP